MKDSGILEMVSGYVDSVSVAGMEVCAVAVIMSAIGCVVGAVVFDILSKRWYA